MVDNVSNPAVIGRIKSVSGVDSEYHGGVDQLAGDAALEWSSLGSEADVSVVHEPPEHVHHAVIKILDGWWDDYGVLEFHGLIPCGWREEDIPPHYTRLQNDQVRALKSQVR